MLQNFAGNRKYEDNRPGILNKLRYNQKNAGRAGIESETRQGAPLTVGIHFYPKMSDMENNGSSMKLNPSGKEANEQT